jgi:group I intron endonuclease
MQKQENVIIGIYKITNPKGKIYIGKSINIIRRFKQYIRLNISPIKLKYSIQKYGVDNHQFEIIEECIKDKLDEREIYWIHYYNSTNNGLNIGLGGEGGNMTDETKLKLSKTWKNKSKKDLKIINEKRRLGNIGKKKPGAGRGKYTLDEKIALGKRSYYKNEFFLKKCRKIIIMLDKYTLEPLREFQSISEAANFIGVKQGTLSGCLIGKSKTSGGYKWKYKQIK